jgi:hypothetical protein
MTGFRGVRKRQRTTQRSFFKQNERANQKKITKKLVSSELKH